MAIAKVILNGVTQMDVTDKTVTAGSMLSGATALKNDGTDITGNIESKTSSDLTVSGATVTAPAGYYASAASKSVASGSARTPNTTITATTEILLSSSGLITANVYGVQSVTPSVSAGYVSSGSVGTITVSGSGTSQIPTQAAQTIHPSTTDQTIASWKYLTGAQTIKAVTTTNLTAENIVSGVTVKVGDSTDDDCVASVTGTASAGATNFVQGTFTTSATTGKQTIDIPYSGNGYPIVAYIEPANGLRTIYDSGQINAVGGWLASKTDKSTAPTYRGDYASMVTISGSPSVGSTSTSFNVQSTYTARNGADSLNPLTSIAFMSATQLSVFIRDSNVGLLPSTVYSYYIVYSE